MPKNRNNYGHVEGTIAEKPTAKEVRGGAFVTVVITTAEDEDDTGFQHERRNRQDVKVETYVSNKVPDMRKELLAAEPGDLASCDYWVQSYEFNTSDGPKTGYSLHTDRFSITKKQDGDETDDEDVDEDDSEDDGDEYYDDYEDYGEYGYEPAQPRRRRNDTADYEFMSAEEIEEIADDGDRDAWDYGHGQGYW